MLFTKRKINFILLNFMLIYFISPTGAFSQNTQGTASSPQVKNQHEKEEEKPPVKFNLWSLIIYRPDEKGILNDIRCYIKITDENGNDVSTTKVKASYEWVSEHRTLYPYKNKYYLCGGMAMHLNLRPGKYIFSFYTPYEQVKNYESAFNFKFEKDRDWVSNSFFYDTENPTYAIFLYPSANENGFYDGAWILDYKAPQFYKWTKPKMSR